MADINAKLQFQEIWIAALTRYKQDTKRDYLDTGLAADSPNALFDILDDELNKVRQYRKKGERVRNAIKPVLELVNMSSDMIGGSLATVSIASAQNFKIYLTLMRPGISTSKSGLCRYSGTAKGMSAVTDSKMNFNYAIELGCKGCQCEL